MTASEGLTLDSITHAYDGATVLHDVSLVVAPGEVVSLLGPSGCGKTTLLRIAAGLEILQAGRVLLDGAVVSGPGAHMPPERRGVGFVFQDFALFPHLSVAANAAFGLSGLSGAAARARAVEILEKVGMAEYADSYPHTLSGGQQQRVALARALAPEPRLVLLDEPFSGLDARLRDRLRDDALHILKTSRVMALLVTHDAEEAMFMSDRIAVMNGGHVVQTGKPEDLYFHPNNAFVANFFGEVNRMEGVVRQGVVDTALGAVAAQGFADGARVAVLIRPEGLLLAPAAEPDPSVPQGRVLASRMLGRTALIHLTAERESFAPVHLHARARNDFLPKEGDRLSIKLDSRQTFVFPLD